MENNTPFDVNGAVRRWRENLAQSPSFLADNLDELESHLRDSLRELEARGLSVEEAFLIATRRIGPGPALAAEFARINRRALWADRMLWILIGWASFSVVRVSVSPLTLLSLATGIRLSPNVPFLLLAVAWASPLILLALILKSVILADATAPRGRAQLLNKPLALSVFFFLVQILPYVFVRAAPTYAFGRPGNIVFSSSAYSAVGILVALIELAIVPLLILIFANRRLRPVAHERSA